MNNKRLLIFLPFLLLLTGVFTSCEEVEEVGRYDNWRERNEAYIDSLNLIIGGRADRIIEGAKYDYLLLRITTIVRQRIPCIFTVRKSRQTIPRGSVRFIRSQLRHTIMVQ